MPRCSASGCRNMGSHTFPKDPHIRALWEKAMNKENFKASKHSRLCYDHFTPSDYPDVSSSLGVTPYHRYLKKSAVPSIFPNNNIRQRTSGASGIETRTSSRQQISRHLKKGVVPSIFPWTKKPASKSEATQQQKDSSRPVLKNTAVPSIFPWNEANSGMQSLINKRRRRCLGRNVKKLNIQAEINNDKECDGDPNLHKFLKKTAVPSIFTNPSKFDLPITSRLRLIKQILAKGSLKVELETCHLKKEVVSPPNTLIKEEISSTSIREENISSTPIKEEKISSTETNNALRNRSVRLKNRKAYLLDRRCSVPQCNSRSSKEITLHPCPNNAAVRNEWAEALRVSYQYVKNMVACSLHFTKLNFIQSSNTERILKHNAVPSRNLPIHKKVVGSSKHKVLRKHEPSSAFQRQQTMTATAGETKEALIPEELQRECRACLQKLDTKKSCCNVFQAWAPPWEGMEATIAEDLAKLANVEISQLDRHSKVLCAPCYQRLLDAAKFAATVRNCDLLLRMRFTAEIDREKIWPKPILVDKNINGSVFNNPMDIEIKQEVVSDEEYQPVNGTENPYVETELSNLDIKIEPEELVEPPPLNITINGTISLDPLNSENKDVQKGTEDIKETNCMQMEIKQEPTSEGEQEIEAPLDLPLECLLCTKSFNSVTGLKAHVIAQHSYKTVKRKADGSVSPEKKRCDLHQCAICKRNFQTSTDLMVHETCHNKHACYGCTEKFDSFELLTRHRNRCKANIGKSVQKLKTLEDVKRPLQEEKVEYLELEILETTDKEKQDIEMKDLDTIKNEDIEMKDLNSEQKENSQEDKVETGNDIAKSVNDISLCTIANEESVTEKAENDKTLVCANEEVENDIQVDNAGKEADHKKSESEKEDVDNEKRTDNVIAEVDIDKQLQSLIRGEEDEMNLESIVEKVDNNVKLLCVIKEVESVIKGDDSDNKTTEIEKEELINKELITETEIEEDPDSSMKLHLEIHSTKNETEPTLCDDDMPVETLDNDDSI